MPVPTETLRNIKRLNIVFAATSVITLVTMLWTMKHDFERPWRNMQTQYFDARSALAHVTLLLYDSPEEKAKLATLESALKKAQDELSAPDKKREEQELKDQLEDVTGRLQGAALTFGNMNAEIQVTAFD